ncbi:unnamed protein product [Kluyveromyces dobzhanskii CBS 2104]|uniref:WGS project CCBQ000000000 data, contig 00107 n=1 Tax=Kluyveromyces dobzhanskii CBS 2104 TaxID=1427455 RepID=A0A0A8L179_9SACH|nr:unnamed protein product [Kluyveromyces dobzhanskii CBS 2104]
MLRSVRGQLWKNVIRMASTEATSESIAAATRQAKFVVKKPVSNQKWRNVLVFGTCFGVGWYTTQHLTLSDIMAWWFYGKLPDTDSKLIDYRDELNQRCDNLSIVKQLLAKGYVAVYKQSDKDGENTLIDKTLRAPGAICIPPRIYYNPMTKDTVSVYHLGMKLTGYPFLVHGGILATVLEDTMRDSVKLVTGKTAEVTQSLKLSYSFPTLANQFVVVRRTKWETKGKNVEIGAELLDQSGTRPLVRGKAVFKLK